ncbi:MAG: hypothetical protein U0N15_07555 [Bifidobacterium choerinum]
MATATMAHTSHRRVRSVADVCAAAAEAVGAGGTDEDCVPKEADGAGGGTAAPGIGAGGVPAEGDGCSGFPQRVQNFDFGSLFDPQC